MGYPLNELTNTIILLDTKRSQGQAGCSSRHDLGSVPKTTESCPHSSRTQEHARIRIDVQRSSEIDQICKALSLEVGTSILAFSNW